MVVRVGVARITVRNSDTPGAMASMVMDHRVKGPGVPPESQPAIPCNVERAKC
jgi:hypothetical protein